jgi:prepilin-type N-terminal cleavage/methylation domain-containing protein
MLQKLQKRKESGFTIIEVLIVLAIAGLILLVVFLAVPALQRNSRNTTRKNDVASLLGAVSEYSNNNGGILPTTAAQVTGNAKLGFYTAANVSLANSNAAIAGASLTVDNVHIRTAAKCNTANDNIGGTGPSARAVAVVYTVETGGGTQNICTES